MNIKTPFRKLHKHTLPFYLLLFLFLSNYVLNVSFVLYQSVIYRLDLSIVFLIMGFIVGVLFIICKFSNPGLLKPKAPSNMFQMLLKKQIARHMLRLQSTSNLTIDRKAIKIPSLLDMLIMYLCLWSSLPMDS